MAARFWPLCLILLLVLLAQASATSKQNLFMSQQSAAAGGSSTPIPDGSLLTVRLVKSLDAKKNKPGEEVAARVMADLKSNGHVAIAKGSRIVGHLTEVQDKSNDGTQSRITMVFERAILKGGAEVPLTAVIQAMATPVDDRTADMTNLERGADSFGITAGQNTSNAYVLTPDVHGVVGYKDLMLQGASIISSAKRVHVSAGSQMILKIGPK